MDQNYWSKSDLFSQSGDGLHEWRNKENKVYDLFGDCGDTHTDTQSNILYEYGRVDL